eukprot:2438696-Lingulodinium_polyedra.AAC.1
MPDDGAVPVIVDGVQLGLPVLRQDEGSLQAGHMRVVQDSLAEDFVVQHGVDLGSNHFLPLGNAP